MATDALIRPGITLASFPKKRRISSERSSLPRPASTIRWTSSGMPMPSATRRRFGTPWKMRMWTGPLSSLRRRDH